jgi:hypothetical protein
VVVVDFAATIEICNGDSSDLRRLTLLVENAVDSALEVISSAEDDVVVGHMSSVRIKPDE